jgi:hypothetical protein
MRFVAALLVADGPAVKAVTDPRIPGAEGLSQVQAAALLTRAHREGRAQRQADDALMAEVGAALREVPGEDKARDAGREAWRIHHERKEGL